MVETSSVNSYTMVSLSLICNYEVLIIDDSSFLIRYRLDGIALPIIMHS